MQKICFKMYLYKGYAEEYKRRLAKVWPELQLLLKRSGISDYSIFFDERTHLLIGVLQLEKGRSLNDLPSQPLMQKWWEYMSDIMETNPDKSPVSIPLEEVFHLP
jgi:L-rhamnose mutarotase